jgi:Flp pilus assembly pilin Flp
MELSIFKAWLSAKLGVTSERGANMVEYVLILTLIALVVIIVVTALGDRVSNRFSSASSALA